MDWKKLGSNIAKAAPLIGTALGGPAGGAVGAMVASFLGVENTPEAIEAKLQNDPQALLRLKELELENERDLRAMVLEIGRQEVEKYKSAHETYRTDHQQADRIAEQVIKFNLPVIALLVCANIGILHTFRDDATLIAIASNVIGVAIGHLFNERQAIVNFFFGSSLGSKQKSEQIKELKEAGK